MIGIDRIKNFPNRTSTALAYFDEPVMITDPNGVLVYLNPRGEENLGLSLNLAIGRHIKELLPGPLAVRLVEGFERIKKTNRSQKLPIMEKEYQYLAHLNPIIKNEKLTGVITYLIAERDRESISRLNQSLFQSLIDEIHRPINKLTVLFSREMEDQDKFKNLYQESKELIKDSIAALNDLIDLSPIMTGELRQARNQFKPALILKLAIRSFRTRAEARKINFYRLDHKELAEVIGDQAKLNRVLVIFLDYLLDITPPGEIISLSTDLRLAPTPILTYSITATGMIKSEQDFYCLSCELSPNFSKLKSEDKKKEKAIVVASRLILAMKGTAQVISFEKIGTTLSFSVPVAIAEKIPEEAEKLE